PTTKPLRRRCCMNPAMRMVTDEAGNDMSGRLADEAARHFAAHRADIAFGLEEADKRRLHGSEIIAGKPDIETYERRSPVESLRDAWNLLEILLAELAHEKSNPGGELRIDAGQASANDRQLALRPGKIEIGIET